MLQTKNKRLTRKNVVGLYPTRAHFFRSIYNIWSIQGLAKSDTSKNVDENIS